MALKRVKPQPRPGLEQSAEPSGSWALRVGYALLLFWLIRAWLVPLQQLSDYTEVYRITPFLVAFALFLVIDTLRMPQAAAWPLKAAIVLAATAVLHSGQWLPGVGWWQSWLRELTEDALHMAQGRFSYISPATRTMLFLAGWGFFIWVLQSFVADRQQLLWFVAMTLVYLIALQLVFDTDMSAGLLGAAGAGLLLQGWLQAERWTRWKRQSAAHYSSRLEDEPARQPEARPEGLWTPVAASAVLTGLCLLGAWLGALQHDPKGRPIDWSEPLSKWEDRLPFLTGPQLGGGAVPASLAAGQTGYGPDDSRLGSPLSQDDTVAFIAKTTRLTYWRGEAKAVYTGRGWYQAETEPVPLVPEAGSPPADPDKDSAAEAAAADLKTASDSVPVRQQVFIKEKGLQHQLFLGGALAKVDSLVSEAGQPISPEWLWQDKRSDKYFLPALADPLSSYSVQVSVPPESHVSERDAYVQLPDSLPARVRELASEITREASTPYDKAKAIERYLLRTYPYSLQNTRPPAAGQDLVDQFLFEQKAGYCDHFSSAMVVLLRSVGIPARWVKGFAPGEVTSTDTLSDGTLLYTVQVRNKDAHSWVEAYMPSGDWLTFDPTPGYGGDVPGGPKVQTASAPASSLKEDSGAGSVIRRLANYALQLSGFTRSLGGFSAALSTASDRGLAVIQRIMMWIEPWLPLSLWIIGACLLVSIIHMWIARRRSSAAAPVRGRQVNRSGAASSYRRRFRAYAAMRQAERLWRKLQRRLGRAEPTQTLREYLLSRQFANDAQRSSLLRFVRLLEEMKYRAGTPPVTRRQLREAWRDVQKSL
ncbi:transglutaminase-like domain-containing protein [Paenibacillus doosanensis]|uniref:transglutaminase-like domain-containing protein n=1 Tax=Paenibacillus doosanensis TaxID=1229154 RepID=UPI00217FF1B7|nr:transglutaminase-like domain-containing protein [Paenibacillus doosanensis]MCS7463413.1 transglutaminase-like domain-containing protein [Paenibacillus doosanensis]